MVANERIKLSQTACLFVHVALDDFFFNSVLLIILAKYPNNDQQLICTADFHCPNFFALDIYGSKWQLFFVHSKCGSCCGG